MNVRLSEGAVRVRIESRELSELLGGSPLQGRTAFPGGRVLCYEVRERAGLPGVSFEDGRISVHASRDDLERLPALAAKRSGLRFRASTGGADALEAMLEIDAFS